MKLLMTGWIALVCLQGGSGGRAVLDEAVLEEALLEGAVLDEVVLDVFNVKDLVYEAAMMDAEKAEITAAERTRSLAETIRTFISPPLKENLEEVKALGTGTLVAKVRSERLEWIRAFLEVQRGARDSQLLIEWKLFSLSAASYQAWQPCDEGSDVRVATAEEATVLEEQCMNQADADILSAPRIVVLNGRKASVMTGTEVAFVKAYKAYERVEPMGTLLVVPVIGTAWEGLTFEGRAVQMDSNCIAFEFKTTAKEIERPIPARMTEHGEVAEPMVSTFSVESKAIVPKGATLIYASPAQQGKWCVQFISLKTL